MCVDLGPILAAISGPRLRWLAENNNINTETQAGLLSPLCHTIAAARIERRYELLTIYNLP